MTELLSGCISRHRNFGPDEGSPPCQSLSDTLRSLSERRLAIRALPLKGPRRDGSRTATVAALNRKGTGRQTGPEVPSAAFLLWKVPDYFGLCIRSSLLEPTGVV
jgi:hypothetical protein